MQNFIIAKYIMREVIRITSFEAGSQHRFWKGGGSDYWRREARKKVNCPKGMVVHHKDNDWKNNTLKNLQVITQAEHVAIHNKQRTGMVKVSSKIKQVIEKVLDIRKQGLKRKEIARILNINERMVKRCLTTEWRCQYETR